MIKFWWFISPDDNRTVEVMTWETSLYNVYRQQKIEVKVAKTMKLHH